MAISMRCMLAVFVSLAMTNEGFSQGGCRGGGGGTGNAGMTAGTAGGTVGVVDTSSLVNAQMANQMAMMQQQANMRQMAYMQTMNRYQGELVAARQRQQSLEKQLLVAKRERAESEKALKAERIVVAKLKREQSGSGASGSPNADSAVTSPSLIASTSRH
jgi:hypothetical protein